MAQILTNDQVDGWVAALRTAGRKIGYTCGAFDLLHAGHVDYLARSRSLCDALLVAVNSDWSIRQYKNPHRPICLERERMLVVAALASVDAVTTLNDLRPLAQIQRWKPDFYIKGGDYGTRKLRSADAVGWTLLRSGHAQEALPWARQALRLGSRDAMFLFHAGMIARAAGRADLARTWLRGALERNPRFSPLYAPRARRALEGLS